MKVQVGPFQAKDLTTPYTRVKDKFHHSGASRKRRLSLQVTIQSGNEARQLLLRQILGLLVVDPWKLDGEARSRTKPSSYAKVDDTPQQLQGIGDRLGRLAFHLIELQPVQVERRNLGRLLP